jgi:hypothetical protein
MKFRMLILLGLPFWVSAEIQFEAEAGRVWAGRADVRIPNEGGTRFSLVDDLEPSSSNYTRIRIGGLFGERHRVLFTWAPLSVDSRGSFEEAVRFNDTLFPADTPLNGRYVFDNYRLTYRYRFQDRGRFRSELGATLFVRDAEISLRGGGLSDTDDDLGFVPLLSGRLEYVLNETWRLVADGDTLIGPQGRATDILFALEVSSRDSLNMGLGYRILEGGADVDEVYTFSLFHHAALTLSWRF